MISVTIKIQEFQKLAFKSRIDKNETQWNANH